MFRISRRADRGILLMSCLARSDAGSARNLALRTGIPEAETTRILRILTRRGLLRNPRDGFALTRPPSQISVAEIIEALEVPAVPAPCGCPACGPKCDRHNAVAMLGRAVLDSLADLTLTDLAALERKP